MTDLHLEREFDASPSELFGWISGQARLLQWFGPEGLHVSEHQLDYSRTGPWHAVMTDGRDFSVKVSGHVTHVDPPRSVGFTWGWHDEQDRRGAESHVTFTVLPTAAGSRLVIDHRDLDDSEQSARHAAGWTSSLRKLAALAK
jgi:uncharacterized protein YndB with AHSA1/START domain